MYLHDGALNYAQKLLFPFVHTGGSSPRGKEAGAKSLSLAFSRCRHYVCLELYLHFPVRLRGMTLN
jgi:hypothetical protein